MFSIYFFNAIFAQSANKCLKQKQNGKNVY
jgi:hypothetical protein